MLAQYALYLKPDISDEVRNDAVKKARLIVMDAKPDYKASLESSPLHLERNRAAGKMFGLLKKKGIDSKMTVYAELGKSVEVLHDE